MSNQDLFTLVDRHRDFAIAAREHLHRHPELGDQEYVTSAYIQACLQEAGVEHYPVPGMTGVVGIVRGERPGKTIALRADMDALPLQESSTKPYRSQNDGVMHACGHDVHTAILLGTARVLQDARHHLQGNVKLFFQPAEETTGGAKRMVAAGCMQNPPVDYVFGLHVDAAIPCGTLRTKAGAFNASSDSYEVVIHGKKAHGSEPHLGQDAIVAAASVVTELQTVVSRRISPHDTVVITVGKIAGGVADNVIADRAHLSIMVRTTCHDARRQANETLVSVIEHACAIHGVTADVRRYRGYDTMYNSKECVEIVRQVANNVLGQGAFSYVERPFMGCEDFCYFCEEVPGVFYQLGSRNEALGIIAPTHSPEYDADPETVPTGMKMQAGIVFTLIGDDTIKIVKETK